MTEIEQMRQKYLEHLQEMQDTQLRAFQQQNQYIRKGQILFTGSSLMAQFPIVEFCQNEQLPPVYNRGIGGFTTEDFLKAADAMLLEPAPSKLFLNIGTNDIRPMQDGQNWMNHLFENYRKIAQLICRYLPETEVYLMAFYPVNSHHPNAGRNPVMSVRTNENIAQANDMLEALAWEYGFHYIDLNDCLKDPQGNLKLEYTYDGIHMSPEAYYAVFTQLRVYLKPNAA